MKLGEAIQDKKETRNYLVSSISAPLSSCNSSSVLETKPSTSILTAEKVKKYNTTKEIKFSCKNKYFVSYYSKNIYTFILMSLLTEGFPISILVVSNI